MDNLKTVRWQQRFQNLDKAFSQLKRGLAIEAPSDIEQLGIIQSFEFTFEVKASFLWYQEQASGLGDDFLVELEYAYQAIN